MGKSETRPPMALFQRRDIMHCTVKSASAYSSVFRVVLLLLLAVLKGCAAGKWLSPQCAS